MKCRLLALAFVLAATGVHADGPEMSALVSKTGDFQVAPDITLRLEKTETGTIRYELKKTTNAADGSVHTLNLGSEFDTEGGDKFLFCWDAAANVLWMASPGLAMTQRFREHKKDDVMLPEVVVSLAQFSKSPRRFQDELRRRFPDNAVFVTIEPSDPR